MRKPMVALVGRPNVGKSTLFNRLVGRRLAVVSEKPGTTRDRIQADAEWDGVSFIVVDTGGIEVESGFHTTPLSEDSARFLPAIRSQAGIAIDAADVIVLIVDAQVGITAADEEVANILRRSTKPVIVAANKAESRSDRDNAFEFYELGLGEVISISALHGIGTGDLLDVILEAFPEPVEDDVELEDDTVKIAIVGRPNVGKSSLLNKLLGQERSIVSEIAGTTRDAIDTYLDWENTPITLIDTAGIRRRGKIDPGVERYSVLRALRSIKRADVSLLLIDAEQGVTSQDEHIAGFILEENTSVVVLVNKWDIIAKDTYTMVEYTKQLRSDLNFMEYVPVLYISALTGKRVQTVLPMALEVFAGRKVRIPTSDLNKLVRDAVARHAPPSKAGKRLRFLYTTQVSVDPPTLIFFVNDPRLVHFSYRRFLENQIREAYPFPGTPLVMRFRPRGKED
ncbi:MAG: ribosome biogenesis GTPase Der [Anaerolineales bacterium]|nr:ribosome biogenesis GTPase Der [Anaerolineales bacterium]